MTAEAGLIRSMLQQEKVSEAADAAHQALTANPKSVEVMVALGEVQYRQGVPWEAARTVQEAAKINPCDAQLLLLTARLLRLDSMYASATKDLNLAHSLDPNNPVIQGEWIETRPLKERIADLELYLSSPTGESTEAIHDLHEKLDWMKKREAEPKHECRLVSSATSTQIPLIEILGDASAQRAFATASTQRSFGLEVKFNGRSSHLEVDTGASGLVINRSIAEHAGLTKLRDIGMYGIGSEGGKKGYLAYAEKIQIGALEFHDCQVSVLDARSVVDVDGLIGADVFSNFLITLDYPARKLGLGPLPSRPNDEGAKSPSLKIDEEGETADESSETPSGSTAKDSSRFHDRYVAPEMKAYSPVYRVGHNLLVPTTVNQGKRKLFILDTGSWTTTISPIAAREVSTVHGDSTLEIHGISGKVDKAYTADRVTLDFAGIRQPADEIVSFDTTTISTGAGIEVSGFIGATTLTQLTTHIDYRDGLVKFDYDPNRVNHYVPDLR